MVSFSYPTFWQTHLWGEILEASWQARKVLNFTTSQWEILIEIRNIGLGMCAGFSLGIDPESVSSEDMARISREIGAERALYWQIEYIWEGWILENEPYRHFLEPWTRVIDLRESLDDILANMHEKGRYNIRLAEKRWVTIEKVAPTEENLDIWMDLLGETLARDEFSGNSREYYTTFLSVLDQKNAWGLYFARRDWRVIAAGIFVYSGETAIYYYGASTSSSEERKHMAPYLLQWYAIMEGKTRWCQVYDFLGVMPPDGRDTHLAWVSSFKEKFGGKVIFLGWKTLLPLSWKYSIFLILRAIKKRI